MDRPLQCDPRYRSLDVWRGLACLMVVIDHVAIPALALDAPDGNPVGVEGWLRARVYEATRLGLGPPMFFVISGYCIAASVDSLRRKGKSAGEFLLRRVWRTLPPYWAAIAAFLVVTVGLDLLGLERLHRGPVGIGLSSPNELDASQWLGNLTLTETWRHNVWGSAYSSVYTRVAWSLCYQEQFYVVCFLAVLLAPRRLYSVLAIASALFIMLRAVLADVGMIHRIEGLFPIFWQEFAVGLAVYWRLNVATNRTERTATDLALLALLGVALRGDQPSTVAAAAFGLVLIAVRRWDARLAALPALAGVRAAGKRCYSIYLMHLPVCAVGNMVLHELGVTTFWARVAIMLPIVSALAVAAGWAFYATVESRFVGLPDWRRRPGPAAPTLAAAV